MMQGADVVHGDAAARQGAGHSGAGVEVADALQRMDSWVVAQPSMGKHAAPVAARDELHAPILGAGRPQGEPDADLLTVVGGSGDGRALMPRRPRAAPSRFAQRVTARYAHSPPPPLSPTP